MPDFLTFNAKSVYQLCAAIGGTILTLQVVLLLFGFDGDHDTDGLDVDHSDGLGFLSVRGIASFLAFFGLVGWHGIDAGWGTGKSSLLGFAAGSAMMLIVLWVMAMMTRLHQQGNVELEGAVGKTANVYLRIPASGEGKGKITISLQGRTHEFGAVTKGDAIPTGAEVRVVRHVADSTFEVEAVQ